MEPGPLGFDFLAYHDAARRILDGHQLYDLSIHKAGGFGLFYYPPPVALLLLPFALLAPAVATWLWTAAIVGAFLLGVALMPVRAWVRWATILLAGLSWPVRLRREAGPGGADPVPAVRDRLALDGPAARAWNVDRAGSADQDPARPPPALGRRIATPRGCRGGRCGWARRTGRLDSPDGRRQYLVRLPDDAAQRE